MKKIVIAADSFKGSLTSKQVAQSIEKGILHVFPNCKTVKTCIADGGEGTVDALVASLNGEYVTALVSDPLMRPIKVCYGIVGKTAIIEMASASGLTLLAPDERNPLITTTFGTGEIILDAIKRGCSHFLVGIGGSATNDAGTGMLQALGFRFLDRHGNELGKGGKILSSIATIDESNVSDRIKNATFSIACDVTASFSGNIGAAYLFAPQKGASAETVKILDEGLAHFATIVQHERNIDLNAIEGAGAAGGLGGGFKAFLRANLVSGIKMVLDALNFASLIKDADLIITGEGKIDAQTAMGKAPRGVLNEAQKLNIPVIAIAGAVENCDELNRQGFCAVFPIVAAPVTLPQAMEPNCAQVNIERTVEQLMKIIAKIKS